MLRTLIARGLRRHAEPAELKDWWWSNKTREVTAAWLRTAADLGVLTRLTTTEAEHVAACARTLTDSPETLVSLLLRSGCDCRLDTVLRPCLVEIGDCLDVGLPVGASDESPVGRLLQAPRRAVNLGKVELRSSPPRQSNQQGGAHERDRVSRSCWHESMPLSQESWLQATDWIDTANWATHSRPSPRSGGQLASAPRTPEHAGQCEPRDRPS